MEYDSGVLSLESAKWVLPNAFMTNFDEEKNLAAFAFMNATKISGTIFTATAKFNVLSNAPVGDTVVKLNIDQLKDADNNNIAITNSSGKITVTCNHSFTEKTTDYLASEATCTSATSYYYSCSICGQKGTNTFTSGEPAAHTYDQQVANADYIVGSGVCVDTADFYYSCKCGAKGTATFTADASWSHSYSNVWYMNEAGYWHACSDCGSKKDQTIHTPDDSNACTVCFFIVDPNADHQHMFGDVWHASNGGHWHECGCGEKSDLDLHAYGEGTVTKEPTTSASGEETFVCIICSHTKVESIPKLAEGGGTTVVQADVTLTSPLTVLGITLLVWQVMAIALGTLILVEATIFVIIIGIKKSKKSKNDAPKEETADAPKAEMADAPETDNTDAPKAEESEENKE